MERKVIITEELVSQSWSKLLDKNVISVNVQNEGTKNLYTGWRETAQAGKGTIEPGSAKAYGLGWPYFLNGNRLSIEFDSGAGQAKALVTIIRDDGVNC